MMHRSTFTGLNMAFTGLNAAQRALDVTGQNITNMHTDGYSRQRVDQIAMGPTGASTYHTPYGARVGQGVLITGISQIRDPFLDNAYRNQLSKLGTEDAKSTTLDKIGGIFDDIDNNMMQEALDDVRKQLQTISLRVGQGGEDSVVRSSFQVLLNRIHQNATELQDIRNELENEMDLTVISDINQILKSIQELNASIKNAQVRGDAALELKDERNLQLDALATYLPIEVTYDKKMMGGDFSIETLNVNLRQADGSKISLIEDDQYRQLSFINAKASKSGKSEIGISKYNGDPWITCTDEDLGNGVLKGKLQMLNCAGQFDGSNINGIAYYENLFNSFVYTMAKGMNDLNNQYMVSGTPLDENGRPKVDADGNPLPDITGAGGDLFEAEGGGPITALNIKISDNWMSGATKLIASQEQAFGATNSTANDNILQMEAFLSTKEIKFLLPGYNVDPSGSGGVNGNPEGEPMIFEGTLPFGYANLQAQYGIDKKALDDTLNNHMLVLQAAADARESVMGVNLDEEVMGLLKYSQAYSASARLMTTMDEALERLINNTGVVGR